MHYCKNCRSPNPAGVVQCQTCRMPGDFGQAPAREAPVVQTKLVGCTNCGGQAPAHAAHCPSCRWPLPVAQVYSARSNPIAPKINYG